MFPQTIDGIKDHLKTKGIKPSLQRVKIYEYLITHRSHPTIDEIYNALADELMTLSKTTVYNTLNLFVEKKVAIVILLEENETRYDADVSNHGHFQCIECNKVLDFNYDLAQHPIKDLEGHMVTEYHAYMKGVCNDCIKSKKEC